MTTVSASPLHWAWLILTAVAFVAGFSLGWLKSYSSAIRLSVAGTGLLCGWLAVIVFGRLIQETGVAPNTAWISPWVWSSGAKAQLSFGVHATELRSTLVWALVSLSTLSFFLILLNPDTRNQDSLYSGLIISMAAGIFGLGVSQEWLTMGALVLGSFGASLASRKEWGEAEHAGSLARMLFNRYLGWLLFVCGVLVAAAQSREPTGYLGVAGVLLAVGIWVETAGFPWSASLSPTHRPPSFLRPMAGEIFPGLMLVLLSVELSRALTAPADEVGIYWIFAISAVMTAFVGLFQQRSDTAASYAFAGMLSLSLAAGTLGQNAAALWIGVGALVLRSMNIFSHQLGLRGATVMKFSAAFSMGLPLSIGFSGFQRLLDAAAAQPGLALMILIAIFSNLILIWKSAMTVKAEGPQKTTPVAWAGVSLATLGGLSLVWTGAWFAGGFSGKDEGVFSSWSAQILGLSATEDSSLNSMQTWGAALFGVQVLALVFAYFSVQRKGDRWIALNETSPRFFAFVSSGFYWSRFGNRGVQGLSAHLERLENLFATQFSGPTWQRIRGRTGPLAAKWVARSERALEREIARSTRTAVEVPGKLLQLIQNGDIQWYLVLSLVLILSFLAHALRTSS